MPPRPPLKPRQNRPISAIYVGSGSPNIDLSSYINTPPNIPDLPEPPSPGANSTTSNDSGLPSPPATNSTDSGSTGDPSGGTISARKRPVSLNSNSSGSAPAMPTTKIFHRSTGSRSSSRQAFNDADGDGEDEAFDGDDHDLNENDEENTARLDRRMAQANKASSEHVLALQRVKSLTQRNRMALDKLSTISRLSSPSPSQPRAGTPTSNPRSHHSSSSSSHASSSRLSQPQRPVSRQARASHDHDHSQTRSGSETEREGDGSSTHSHSHYTPSSSTSSHTPYSHRHTQSTSSVLTHPHIFMDGDGNRDRSRRASPLPPAPSASTTHDARARVRLASAPDPPASPSKARIMSMGSISSGGSGSPSRRRKRASVGGGGAIGRVVDEDEEYERDWDRGRNRSRSRDRHYEAGDRDVQRDVMQSALAAVASSRRSPVGTRKPRAALPREFRGGDGEGDHTMSSGRGGDSLDERSNGRISTEPPQTPHRNRNSTGTVQFSPVKQTLGRSSTVREPGRRYMGQGRWVSEDLSFDRETGRGRGDPNRDGTTALGRGRRQTLRAGSAESVLASGRTLVGEGLRAAGLGWRESGRSGDVFVGGRREGGKKVEWSAYSDSVDDGHVKTRQVETRAATSMADYRYLDGEPAPPSSVLRSYKSAYPLQARDRERELDRREASLTRREREMERERAPSAMSRQNSTTTSSSSAMSASSSGGVGPVAQAPLPALQLVQYQERHASPFGRPRYGSPAPPAGSGTGTEHTRLMAESLTMFEGHLGKMQGGGTVAGVGSHAELVRNAQGVVYAAERLNVFLRSGAARAMEAQVDAEVDGGGERDLVDVWRGVGLEYREGVKVSDELVRGMTGFLLGVGRVMKDLGGGEGASVHGRSVSLDAEGAGKAGSDHSGGSGRRSVDIDLRRSWEPGRSDREREREDALRRLSGRVDRPGSAFNMLRDRETPPSLAAPAAKTGPRHSTGSMRRLYTPRDQQANTSSAGPGMVSLDSLDSLNGYEPSPTPAPRQNVQLDRSRTLPPLSIPKPLPTLPSESTQRRTQGLAEKSTHTPIRDRRKPSVASLSTVRATPSFPAISTPNATTALTTHTVSTSPDRMSPFPSGSLLRPDLGKGRSSTVTFSRPSTVSVNTLSGLQQQDLELERRRSGSGTSPGASPGAEPSTSATTIHPPPLPPQKIRDLRGPVTPLSGSETERDTRRRTIGSRVMRMSLDGGGDGVAGGSKMSTVHAADRSAAATVLPHLNPVRRERRRTVTDIWPSG